MQNQRSLLVFPAGVILVALAVLAQQSATEAPTGFDTPAVSASPGSQSTSNGIAQPAGDTFALDQKIFETVEDPATNGLGPLFNATACAACHQNVVTGAAGQITEIRVRIKARFMHDLRSMTLEDAIHRHKGEAAGVITSFRALTTAEQGQIIVFLRSL